MKKLTTMLGILMCYLNLQAQFLAPTDFAPGLVKDVTVIDKDNKVIQGEISGIVNVNGNIKSFKIKPVDGGEKVKFTVDDVKRIIAKVTKMGQVAGFGGNGTLQSMGKTKHTTAADSLYYEVVTDAEGKKKIYQLINPGFDSKIKVYSDPNAKQTTSFTGLDGGMDKSYIVVKNGAAGFILLKKEYKKMFESLFGDCAELKALPDDKKYDWNFFAKYVVTYDECIK